MDLEGDLHDAATPQAVFPAENTRETRKLVSAIDVQIDYLINVADPPYAQYRSAVSDGGLRPGGRRLLKCKLTDGISKMIAVEIEPVPDLSIDTPRLTKIRIPAGARLVAGVLCLDRKVKVLGGPRRPLEVVRAQYRQLLADFIGIDECENQGPAPHGTTVVGGDDGDEGNNENSAAMAMDITANDDVDDDDFAAMIAVAEAGNDFDIDVDKTHAHVTSAKEARQPTAVTNDSDDLSMRPATAATLVNPTATCTAVYRGDQPTKRPRTKPLGETTVSSENPNAPSTTTRRGDQLTKLPMAKSPGSRLDSNKNWPKGNSLSLPEVLKRWSVGAGPSHVIATMSIESCGKGLLVEDESWRMYVKLQEQHSAVVDTLVLAREVGFPAVEFVRRKAAAKVEGVAAVKQLKDQMISIRKLLMQKLFASREYLLDLTGPVMNIVDFR